MPKESLKDKLEGNELDLSLNNLDTVPVKDLVCLFKIVKSICKTSVQYCSNVYTTDTICRVFKI